MYYEQSTIRTSDRRRKGPEAKPMRTRKPGPTLSLLVAALVLTSPTTNDLREGHQEGRIHYWAAEAMSPTAELTAAAAAAVVRRNVISGAAIFTVGDAAAQMLTSRQRKTKGPAITTTDTIDVPYLNENDNIGGMEGNSAVSINRKAAKRNILANTVSSLDKNRLWSSTVLGAIWSGFCVPFIYGNVERTFPGKANLRQILVKVLVTCSILSTIGNYATMFARRFVALFTMYQFDKTSSLRLKWLSRPIESVFLFLAIFKGCFKSCNRDIAEVIVDDLKIWPLYDLTCYSLIPPAWRPLTTSIMSSGWAMYMSVASAKEEQEEEDYEPVVQAAASSMIKPTIRVTPLTNPFQKPIAATSETTKRLIGVSGGDASDPSTHGKNTNTYNANLIARNSPQVRDYHSEETLKP
jgi:hypothetical protein